MTTPLELTDNEIDGLGRIFGRHGSDLVSITNSQLFEETVAAINAILRVRLGDGETYSFEVVLTDGFTVTVANVATVRIERDPDHAALLDQAGKLLLVVPLRALQRITRVDPEPSP